MKPVTIYDVKLTGEHKVEAASSSEAIQKTIEYFAAHLDQLDFSWTQQTVYVVEEEE
jgi:virulence-associated protein VapD